MDVRLMNPDVVKDLYKNHGKFACVCYATPEEHAEKVGKACAHSGHMSGSRCEYIKFFVTDIDRGTAEQCLRHEIGTAIPVGLQDNYSISDYMDIVTTIPADQIVKNMASFRYIDKDGFKWATPKNIAAFEDVKQRYDALMEHINYERRMLKEMLENHGIAPRRATEDVNMVLPRATLSGFMIGFTPEALIHFMHKRLCTRAQEFIHEVAVKMRDELYCYNHAFARECQPHCRYLIWCPERDCCGAAPTKEEIKRILAEVQAGKDEL